MKQQSEDIIDAYCAYSWIGPCFGKSFDLQLICEYGNYCNHFNTVFQGNIIGNSLCGGNRFEAENKMYQFDIVNMTTFQIDFA